MNDKLGSWNDLVMVEELEGKITDYIIRCKYV